MKEFPKILFINISFFYDDSAGLTISKLINFIPRENLGVLSVDAESSNINIFGHKYDLSEKELNNIAYFKNKNLRKNKTEFKSESAYKLLKKKIKKIVRSILGKKIHIVKYKISSPLKEWLNNFSPDYIYINPDNAPTIIFAKKLSEIFDYKIIIHILDDKVTMHYPGLTGLVLKAYFKKHFVDIINKSSLRLSISHKMSDEYYKRYGKEFHPFHNPISSRVWENFQSTPKYLNKDREIKILYSGFVGFTFKPIFEFCQALNELYNSGFNIKFILYSKFSDYQAVEDIKRFPFIIINNYVEQEELPYVLSEADLLLLPFSFEKKYHFAFLSMPTKTTEYMISGIPIIVYSPRGTAIEEYARNEGWAYIIDTNKSEAVVKALKAIINNLGLRRKYSTKAMSLARKEHDINHIQSNLYNILSEQS